ncbi:MAG: TonB-dependent receptor plug domain-containing protein [Candidatus Poribacteria bacterium]
MMAYNKNIRIAIFCIIILITNSITAVADEEASAKRELLLFQDIPVVSAAKYEQNIDKAPASITIITSEDIEMYGYRTLADVLETVRGFYVSYDRNYTYIGVRSFGRPTDYNDRILLLVNGHTMNEGIFGSAFVDIGLGIDLNSVERIEVIRGPGSTLYGTCAMFAVVNVITKKGVESNGLKASVSSGSYRKIQGNTTFGHYFDNGLDLFVSGLFGDIKGQDLYYKEYDDPSTNNGIAERLDWDKYNGLLLTSTYRNFSLQGIMNSRNKGIPTGSWDTLFISDGSKTLDGHRFIELKYDHSINDDKNVMFRNYFDNYYY